MTTSSALPSALNAIDSLLGQRQQIAVFLDYDGTLTPIVSRPEDAVLSDGMRETVLSVAARYPVVIVSGRGRRNVEALVGIDGLGYVGSHGFDILGPSGSSVAREIAANALPLLDTAEVELRQALEGIPGALVERKRFGIAVHFRLVADAAFGQIEQAVQNVLSTRDGLRRAEGKKVIELRPDVDWDKGCAVLWLLEELGLDDAHAIHIGDDLTDETVFAAVADRGTGIFVGNDDRPTAATFRLDDTKQVGEFLDRLTVA
ncbi:MAG: trehalose-phosphatase [Candidatus Binatia bacterium]|nr:trehalose-phosphatase [Candidatus Binatia bacterium]